MNNEENGIKTCQVVFMMAKISWMKTFYQGSCRRIQTCFSDGSCVFCLVLVGNDIKSQMIYGSPIGFSRQGMDRSGLPLPASLGLPGSDLCFIEAGTFQEQGGAHNIMTSPRSYVMSVLSCKTLCFTLKP